MLSWNIHGGIGMDGHRSTRRIGQVIAESGADIVCLQEVHERLPWSGLADQPRILSRILGVPFHFQRCLNMGIGGYGLGILSRFPVSTVRRHRLPSVGEQRGAFEVQIVADGALIRIFCTHWGLNTGERARQSAALSRLIASSPELVVVCGDLNAPPDAACVTDLLAHGGMGSAGGQDAQPTFPAVSPTSAIDYILHSNDLEVQDFRVISTTASDHLPIVADFRLSGQPHPNPLLRKGEGARKDLVERGLTAIQLK